MQVGFLRSPYFPGFVIPDAAKAAIRNPAPGFAINIWIPGPTLTRRPGM